MRLEQSLTWCFHALHCGDQALHDIQAAADNKALPLLEPSVHNKNGSSGPVRYELCCDSEMPNPGCMRSEACVQALLPLDDDVSDLLVLPFEDDCLTKLLEEEVTNSSGAVSDPGAAAATTAAANESSECASMLITMLHVRHTHSIWSTRVCCHMRGAQSQL